MSTRASRWYWGPFHVYEEMLTDWVRLEVGDWLDIGLYKRPRGYRSKWFGKLACHRGYHDWLIDIESPPRGPATYHCRRPACGARK